MAHNSKLVLSIVSNCHSKQPCIWSWQTLAYCLHFSTVAKCFNLNSICRLQIPWLTVSLGRGQCDQIGRFMALWATFQSLWQQLFCPHFSSENFWATFIDIWRLFTGHAGKGHFGLFCRNRLAGREQLDGKSTRTIKLTRSLPLCRRLRGRRFCFWFRGRTRGHGR